MTNPRTNYRVVVDWMRWIGQTIPANPCEIDHASGVVELRRALIDEEAGEVIEALEALPRPVQPEHVELLAEAVKELGDLLVVGYGSLAAMGVDGDKIFRIVMEENQKKLQYGYKRDDGKWVVPPETKAKLRAECKASIISYINTLVEAETHSA